MTNLVQTLRLLREEDRNELKGMLDPTANDQRLIELAVNLCVDLAMHVHDDMGVKKLIIVDHGGRQRDIELGEWP